MSKSINDPILDPETLMRDWAVCPQCGFGECDINDESGYCSECSFSISFDYVDHIFRGWDEDEDLDESHFVTDEDEDESWEDELDEQHEDECDCCFEYDADCNCDSDDESSEDYEQ